MVPPPDPFEDDCPADINLNALSSIMDLRNIRHDGVTIDGIFEIENPLAFAAGSNNNPDILSQSQMLKAADRDEFLKVQGSELLGLHDADVFEYLPRSKLPSGSRVLNAIWSYRRKRKPDGTLSKYKSRICADGSQQKYGIDYWETYSPVVNWSTVRLVFVLATMLGLKGCQVDYVQAFPQAPLDDPVFIQIPEGWKLDSLQENLSAS